MPDAGDIAEQHGEVGLLPQDGADRLRDVGRGETGGGDLVEQWLEEVMILPVDDRDAGEFGRELLRKGKTAEAAAEDHDVREGHV
jgi:hypothetical protein